MSNPAPEILHQSTGLTIKKNPKNGFIVCTLHYTAAENKRNFEWIKEARAGLSPAKWAREYEIEYFAMMGQKIFPELGPNKDKIVVKDPYPTIPGNHPCWGGFDFGSRNPSSFHVYTMIDKVIYSVWEIFEPCINISEFSQKLLACPYWHQIKYVAADPSLWSPTQQTREGNVTSIHQLLWDCGVRKMIKGIQDEQAFVVKIHDLWRDLDKKDPLFRIFDCCPNQIREFETTVYVSMSERQSLTKSYREQMQDKDNHSLDDAKYFFNSQPTFKVRNINLPNMSKWWRK